MPIKNENVQTSPAGQQGQDARVLTPLLTLATLRVSLTHPTERRFPISTLHPKTQQWFRQELLVDYNKDLGYPNPTTQKVLVGLMFLTRQSRNNSPTLDFTQEELLAIMGRPPNWSQPQARLDKSLRILAALQLTLKQGRFDAAKQEWEPQTWGIFTIAREPTPQKKAYQITWSDLVFRGIQQLPAPLDLSTYLHFKNAVACNIYVHTAEKFATANRLEFPLRHFAEDKVRLSLDYTDSNLKRKLTRGLDELEQAGYLQPMLREERFPVRDDPIIILQRAPSPTKTDPKPVAPRSVNPEPNRRLGNTQQIELCLFSPPVTPAATDLRHSPVCPTYYNKVEDARDHAIAEFYASLTTEERQRQESMALSRANVYQRELLKQPSPTADQLKRDLLRIHALCLMASTSTAA